MTEKPEPYTLSFREARTRLLELGYPNTAVLTAMHDAQSTGLGRLHATSTRTHTVHGIAGGRFHIADPVPYTPLPPWQEDLISEAELAMALGRMAPGGPDLVRNPGESAEHIFRIARDLRAEAGRWTEGELYGHRITGMPAMAGAEAAPAWEICLRQPGGWFSYTSHSHFDDGQLDTSQFRHLTLDGGGPQ